MYLTLPHPILVSPNGFLANTTSFKTRLGVYLTLPIRFCPSDPGLAQWFPRQHDFLQDTTGCVSDSAHPIPVSPNGFLTNTTSFKTRWGVYLILPRTKSRARFSSPTRLPSGHDWCVFDSAHLNQVSRKIFVANTTSFETRLGVCVCVSDSAHPSPVSSMFPRQHGFLQDAIGCVSDSAHPILVLPNGFLTNTTSRYDRVCI